MSENDHPESVQEAIEWAERKEEKARSVYHEGTRSDNPRRTDVNLGKLRAYRDCKRVLKMMQAQNHK